MGFIREDYKETQRRRRTVIAILSLAGIVIFFILYNNIFVSEETPGKRTDVKPPQVVVKQREKAVEKKPKKPKKKDLPTIFAETRPSVALIKTFDREDNPVGIGSGFFINAGGHLISNRHVLKNAHRAEVENINGKYTVNKVVSVNIDCDLVRLAVDTGNKGVVPLKTNDSLPKIGESVLVIGNPLGLESTVSDGIVSALRKVEPFGTIIQITSPISPGSSGSPVLNMRGEVIGVATFQMREGQNLNFAIPIGRLKDLEPTESDTLAAVNFGDSQLVDSMEDAFDQGMVLFGGKQYDAAIPYFKKVISKDAANAEAYYHLGICYRETGATNAIDAFKAAIDIRPEYAEAYCHLGITYLRFNMREEAIKALKEALQLRPDYEEALLNLGITYALSKRYKSAVSVLEKAVEIFQDAKAYYYLGYSYTQLKKHAKATRAFRDSVDMDPDFLEAYLGLGAAYGAVENWRLGIKILNRAVLMEPQNAEVHFLLGMLHLGNDDLESAQREYEILKKLKDSSKFRNQLSSSIRNYKYNRKQRYR